MKKGARMSFWGCGFKSGSPSRCTNWRVQWKKGIRDFLATMLCWFHCSMKQNVSFPGGVLPEKLGRGVRPASQNPYPIYDQNLRFFLPSLWPDQKFDTLFMTLVHSCCKHKFVKGFCCKNRYPIYVQNRWKTIPFGAAHTYIVHIREYPPPRGFLCFSL